MEVVWLEKDYWILVFSGQAAGFFAGDVELFVVAVVADDGFCGVGEV